MDISSGIQSLLRSLEDLRGAVHAGEHDHAQQLVKAYDQDVRALFAEPVSPVTVQELQRLLAVQHAVMDEMCQLRDEAGRHISAGHRSLRAAHAYLKAESLA